MRSEPCSAGQRCVNLPGSFQCRSSDIDDRGRGDRQSDVAVSEGGLDGPSGPPGVTRPPTEQTSSSTTTTTATTTRRRRPWDRHCGTGFQFNRQTKQCEGTSDQHGMN